MPKDPRTLSGGRAAVDDFIGGGSVQSAMQAASKAEKGAAITTLVGSSKPSSARDLPEDPFDALMREKPFANPEAEAEFAASDEGKKHAETSKQLMQDLAAHLGDEKPFTLAPAPVEPASKRSVEHLALEAMAAGIKQLEEVVDETTVILRKHNMTRKQAEEIMDCLVIQNIRYRERIELLKGRVSVVFQTRIVSDVDLLAEVIETRRPQYQEAMNNERWRHLLAASIVRYAGMSFASSTVEDYDKRIRWVNSLSEPLFNMLAVALETFDMKTQAVLQPSFLRSF